MSSAVTELLSYVASIIGPAAGDPRTAASVRTPLGSIASRTKWLKEILSDRLIGVEKTIASCTVAAPGVFTSTAHGFAANTAIRFFAGTSGVLPTGILADTIYYVDATTADTFKVSLVSGPGALVTTTGAMTGPIFAAAIPDWITTLLIANATYGYGKITDLVVFLAGAQTITGAKVVEDITASGVTKYKLASRSKERVGKSPWWDDADNTMRMPSVFSAVVGSIYQAAIDLPNGSTLTSITLTVDPALHVALPANMPTLIAYKVPLSTGVSASLFALVTDSSANAGDYSALHTITKTGLSEVIDNATYAYFVQYEHESGADSAAGVVVGVKYAATVTSMDDFAS